MKNQHFIKILSVCLFVLAFSFKAFALDFAVRLSPEMDFPSDGDLNLGFGTAVNLDLDLFNFFTVGLEGGYNQIKQNNLDENFNIFSGGLCAGLYFYPLSRLYLSANASYGLYSISINSPGEAGSANGLYYRAFGEMGFRFTPQFVLSANGGYKSVLIDGSPFISTPFAGLGLKFNFSTKNTVSSDNFSVHFEQDSFVLPVYASSYSKNPLGYATLQNTSSAEVRDVHVYFRAGKYTSSEKECASFYMLKKYQKKDIPVYAEFGPEILKYSEDGKINGELVISYSFLGKRMTEIQNIVIDIKHRNSFFWNTEYGVESLACFIDSGTPEILEAAKYLAGTEITNLKTGMNSAFQYSAAIIEGLRLAGIVYSEDVVTPYKTFRNESEADSILYPLQTLNLLGGDWDDIGLLVCSCLESFGIGTGFIALEDDFIVLVDTQIAPEKKQNQFREDSVISDEDTTYLALSMANFSKGFTNARLAASKKLSSLQKNVAEDEDLPYKIVNTHKAWETFPPVSFSGYRGSYKNPSKDAVIKAVNDATSYYINNDLSALIKKFRSSGDTKLLADTYVRAGMYSEALAEYQKLNTTSAWNNMGLVYSAQKNYRQALAMYNKVLAKEPNNKTALSNIKKIQILVGE